MNPSQKQIPIVEFAEVKFEPAVLRSKTSLKPVARQRERHRADIPRRDDFARGWKILRAGSEGVRSLGPLVQSFRPRPPGPIIEISEGNFESEVLRWKQPVLVAFSAAWSRPCQILDSVLEKVAAACAGRMKVARINADNHPDLGLIWKIQSIPTLLCFADGSLRARIVGTASKEAILSKLRPVTDGGDSKTLDSAANNV